MRGSRVSAAAPVGALFVCRRHTAPPRPQGLTSQGKVGRRERYIYGDVTPEICRSTRGAALPHHTALRPACALRVAKRRPLYRNTRNLTIAKVPPHFWGYGIPVAGGQHQPRWQRRLCRVRSAFCYALKQTFLALLEKTRALRLCSLTQPKAAGRGQRAKSSPEVRGRRSVLCGRSRAKDASFSPTGGGGIILLGKYKWKKVVYNRRKRRKRRGGQRPRGCAVQEGARP